MTNPLPDLKTLQANLQGQVIGPDHPEYDAARTMFYGGLDHKPVVIIRVANRNEVPTVVRLAQQTGLPLSIRSGGHSFSGHSVADQGIMLDLRNLKQLDIDHSAKTAWIETGLTAGEVTQALDAHNLVIGFGDTGSVGVGGITLGGGVGFLVRKHGLTIDSVLAAEVVTADGQTLTASATEHPDLFWAIRGGGGNFGVVTRFQFQLHDLSEVVGGMLLLPAEPKVLAGFMAAAAAAPAELSAILNVMPTPPMPFVPAELHGKMTLMALMVYSGDPAQAESVLAPFRALATPIVDQLKPMRYVEMFHPVDDSYHPTAVAQTMFMNQVNEKTAETIIQTLTEFDAPMRVVQLRPLGAAVAQVAADATAFVHRQSPIMVNIAAFYTTPTEQATRQTWVDSLAKTLNQGDKGAYVNFMAPTDLSQVQKAYPGETWTKLRQIKRQYDPTNLFRLNFNVPPAEA